MYRSFSSPLKKYIHDFYYLVDTIYDKKILLEIA